MRIPSCVENTSCIRDAVKKFDDKLLFYALHLRLAFWCALNDMKISGKLVSIFHCRCPSPPGLWPANSNHFPNNISPSQEIPGLFLRLSLSFHSGPRKGTQVTSFLWFLLWGHGKRCWSQCSSIFPLLALGLFYCFKS